MVNTVSSTVCRFPRRKVSSPAVRGFLDWVNQEGLLFVGWYPPVGSWTERL